MSESRDVAPKTCFSPHSCGLTIEEQSSVRVEHSSVPLNTLGEKMKSTKIRGAQKQLVYRLSAHSSLSLEAEGSAGLLY